MRELPMSVGTFHFEFFGAASASQRRAHVNASAPPKKPKKPPLEKSKLLPTKPPKMPQASMPQTQMATLFILAAPLASSS